MKTVKTKHFDYGNKEIEYLRKVDKTLGKAIEKMERVERTVIPDLFAALIYAIIGQLISAKAVDTIWNRMQEQFGKISPENMSKLSADEIQKCGITMKKAVCIKNIAETVNNGEFNLNELCNLSDEEVIKRLSTLKGIGKWTAEMLLINSMERLDVVSFDDIAIRRGICKLYGLESVTKEEFKKYKERYSPYGSVASIYLWKLSFE